MNTIDLTIHHDGQQWIARNAQLTVSGRTIEELDTAVEQGLRQKGALPDGRTARVFMAFDNATIPQWIRQYAQHYFNRIIEVRG